MQRWLGIGMLVLAAFIMFTGWATWSGIGDEVDALQGARAVTADELDQARDGELVAAEGTTVEQHTGPVSGAPAAWYRVTRVHRWMERRATCRRAVPCRREWGARRKSLGDDTARTMSVQLAGSDRTLNLKIPAGDDAVSRVERGESDKVLLDIPPTDTHKDDYEDRREYLLEPDATVTVVGTVKGDGDDRTIIPKEGLALVYNAPRSAMLDDLRGYETAGIVMMVIGALLAIGGILLLTGRRLRRPRAPGAGATAGKQVLREELPPRTVLGGPNNPMERNVRCLACGQSIKLEYHDILTRWHIATSTPQATPAWQPFNTARQIQAGEAPLDMSCTRCAQPVRVIVRGNEWRMSLLEFHIVELLAIAPSQSSAHSPAHLGPISR